jgi:hypothetical protein
MSRASGTRASFTFFPRPSPAGPQPHRKIRRSQSEECPPPRLLVVIRSGSLQHSLVNCLAVGLPPRWRRRMSLMMLLASSASCSRYWPLDAVQLQPDPVPSLLSKRIQHTSLQRVPRQCRVSTLTSCLSTASGGPGRAWTGTYWHCDKANWRKCRMLSPLSPCLETAQQVAGAGSK